ncbi:MAG: signal peptidase I [Pedococcus sp.]
MTPTSGSQDGGWLGFDRASADASDQADPASDQADLASDQADLAAGPTRPGDQGPPSPWLRHDLAAYPSSTDPDPVSGHDCGAGDHRDPGAGREAAWLEPELQVSAPPTEVTHDTGVPPTLAEEPPTVQPSDPAGGTAHDEPLPTADAEATGPRMERDGDADPGEDEAGVVAVVAAAIKEFAIVVGMALVLSFIVKTWLLQAFYIPSGSMEDTLVLNDRVIVSKLTPGPVDLKRGDIIVFADPGQWLDAAPTVPHGRVVSAIRETMTFVGLLPDNSENHLIKRVIGLPGDRVVCCDEGGRLTVNGAAIKEPYLKSGDAASDQDFDITVPSGRVWVMGDHRSNSADSRAHDAPENDGSRGSVDERLIVGRAVALVWPLDHLTWLSNPTATFAKVPNPTSEDTPQPSSTPSGTPSGTAPGDPGSQTGGVEVPGGDGGG